MYKAKGIIKIMFILTMFVLNVWYVALPCITKYLDGGVMIEVDHISPESIEPPAITFATLGRVDRDGG